MKDSFNPEFDDSQFGRDNSSLSPSEALNGHLRDLQRQEAPLPHESILKHLLECLEERDFNVLAYPKLKELREEYSSADKEDQVRLAKQMDKMKANKTQLTVLCVDEIMKEAKQHNWGICKNHGSIFLWNSTHWKEIDKDDFQPFLGEGAEKMGVPKLQAKYHLFRDGLFKQFMAVSNLPTPEPPEGKILVNLSNGTFEVSKEGTRLRPFDPADFLTYQLPFEYDKTAKAPLFQQYLDKVQPDKERQKILAEYLGYVFIHPSSLKLEKALLLYGSGANGKSVFYEVVNALIGDDNISNFSLESLTDVKGYYRAKIGNKLLNYASEINGKLESSLFKQLVSGEPVEARLPFGDPFHVSNYAKLIFNCNELPREVEHTNAFFRRFLIVPFEVTIPEKEQDIDLPKKIIEQELTGVFNWVLSGLDRLLKQRKFTHSKAVEQARKEYEKESDSTKMFLDEMGYKRDPDKYVKLSDLYKEYQVYCYDSGCKSVGKVKFKKRLEASGIDFKRRNSGIVAFIRCDLPPPDLL